MNDCWSPKAKFEKKKKKKKRKKKRIKLSLELYRIYFEWYRTDSQILTKIDGER